jgi:hypothetical protein
LSGVRREFMPPQLKTKQNHPPSLLLPLNNERA